MSRIRVIGGTSIGKVNVCVEAHDVYTEELVYARSSEEWKAIIDPKKGLIIKTLYFTYPRMDFGGTHRAYRRFLLPGVVRGVKIDHLSVVDSERVTAQVSGVTIVATPLENA